jgi:hypothetical protein
VCHHRFQSGEDPVYDFYLITLRELLTQLLDLIGAGVIPQLGQSAIVNRRIRPPN